MENLTTYTSYLQDLLTQLEAEQEGQLNALERDNQKRLYLQEVKIYKQVMVKVDQAVEKDLEMEKKSETALNEAREKYKDQPMLLKMAEETHKVRNVYVETAVATGNSIIKNFKFLKVPLLEMPA
ncbi:hypothetical protein KC866_01655 [Patescibacteria group bacterium]|nr:hypothetical protein [Patescibacteria group bacterium]